MPARRSTARVKQSLLVDIDLTPFSHDLDFGAILASACAVSPSVVQLRTNDVTPQASGTLVLEVLMSFETQLEKGALLTVDEEGSRVRLLPLCLP